MKDISNIEAAVADARTALRLTQSALAKRAPISRATLDALENNRVGAIGFTKLIRILAAVGLELRLQKASPGRPTLDELLAEEAGQP